MCTAACCRAAAQPASKTAIHPPERQVGDTSTSGATIGAMTSPSWLSDHEQEVWRGLLAMNMQLDGRLRRSLVQRSGLSDAEYAVLVCLSEAPDGRLRAFELVKGLAWEKSRLSHQLRRMQARGLVERDECDTDRRGSFVVLTGAGRAAIEAAAPHHVADVRRWFFDALSPAQLDALLDVTSTVRAHLDAEGG
jgi:DNA-binding MarR family transcriptional regulator